MPLACQDCVTAGCLCANCYQMASGRQRLIRPHADAITVSPEVMAFLRKCEHAPERIRARIAAVEGMIERRKAYRADCIADDDEHGCWDAAVNIAEFKSEIAGLQFALGLLG